ncbi:DMT family transporter [Desertivibrio insolitus]|uniref:DMT family transporter n=1 Tax=Herbiconiux sp. SYSU D00978 TaxID=2812562 RepID=UPI0027DE669D|nr:DMT family transporter [Herbiconiux sp. SYSU D00978]
MPARLGVVRTATPPVAPVPVPEPPVSLPDALAGFEEARRTVGDPRTWIAIVLAVIGAACMSGGAQLQHAGVAKVEAVAREELQEIRGLGRQQILDLLRRPSWLLGTVLLGLAILLQLTALSMAPLIVVQPVGAIALVITAFMNARISQSKLNRASVRSIALCVGGIALFVVLAAIFGVESKITEQQLLTILAILGVTIVAFFAAFVWLRDRAGALLYIIGAGVLYGFVATLAKVVLVRIFQGDFEILTLLCLAALLAAAALGAWFVQNAYSSGPPDLVIAGLTVVDPLIAVAIGILVLGEAATAPVYALVLFAVFGVVAIYGVFQLAKHHPQVTA